MSRLSNLSRIRKIILSLLGLGILGFIVIQFIPMGNFFSSLKRVENPPSTVEIMWDSPETERLLRAACFDCHSNETVWPWYSYIAPVSWLITRDVNNGRYAMNFSTEGADKIDPNDIEGHMNSNMPPWYYLPLHLNAKLSAVDKAKVVAGLRAMYGEGGMGGMDMGGG